MDYTDQYIIEHHRSMSQPEMAEKLGLNKSTISRRMSKLKADGAIEATPNGESRETQLARDRLRGCAMNRADRLAALGELKNMLHADLLTSGGSSLARVSSEYRRTLEEIESLSVELDMAANAAQNLNPAQIARMKALARERFASACGRDATAEIIDYTLNWLNSLGVIAYTPYDSIMSNASAIDQEIAEGGGHGEQ